MHNNSSSKGIEKKSELDEIPDHNTDHSIRRNTKRTKNDLPYDDLREQPKGRIQSQFEEITSEYESSKRNIWLWPREPRKDFPEDWKQGGYYGWEETYYMLKKAVFQETKIAKVEQTKLSGIKEDVIIDLANLDDAKRPKLIKDIVGGLVMSFPNKRERVCGEVIWNGYMHKGYRS